MTTIPTMPTKSVGDKLTASDWNTYVRDAVNTLLSPARVLAFQSGGGQSLTTGSTAAVILNDETGAWDTDGIHSTSTNNTRFTIPSGLAGKWRLTGQVSIPANATGMRSITIRKNGATQLGQVNGAATSANAWVGQVVAEDAGAVGDYYELLAFQNSGSSLTIVTGIGQTWMSGIWTGQ